MTIRLSAMFEEHMRRIIYNWKSARRRENISKNKKRKSKIRTRNNGQRTRYKRPDSSEEEEEEITPPSSPVRKSTPRKANSIANGHASTSRANGPVSRPVIRVRPSSVRSHLTDSSDEEEGIGFRSHRKNSDSEESYRPNSRGKKIVRQTRNKGKKKKSFSGEMDRSDESDISKRTRAKTNLSHRLSDDYDDSDDEPLVNCRTEAATSWNENTDVSEEETVLRNSSRSLRSSHPSLDESSQGSSTRKRRAVTRKNYEETEEESEDEGAQLPQRSARAKRLNYRAMLALSGDSEDEEVSMSLMVLKLIFCLIFYVLYRNIFFYF